MYTKCFANISLEIEQRFNKMMTMTKWQNLTKSNHRMHWHWKSTKYELINSQYFFPLPVFKRFFADGRHTRTHTNMCLVLWYIEKVNIYFLCALLLFFSCVSIFSFVQSNVSFFISRSFCTGFVRDYADVSRISHNQIVNTISRFSPLFFYVFQFFCIEKDTDSVMCSVIEYIMNLSCVAYT